MQTTSSPELVVERSATTARPTPFLSTERIAAMLQRRRAFQVVKFRTNCSDCVPNL